MRISGAFRALLLFSTLKGGASESMKGLLRNSEIPDSGKEWVTLENGVQYQPAHENLSRKLTGNLFGGSPYRKAFVDGTETYYDEDAQAWRLLGFYIDCNSREDDLESGESEEAYRDLEEENDAYFETTCMRYLVWAAYIDPGYTGGGIAEYKQFNRQTEQWDSTPCENSSSERCVKMNCHQSYTNFELLGIFKEPSYDYWFDQLSKHQGSCVWTEEEYNNVQQQQGVWPVDCVKVGTKDDEGNFISVYYHTKPVQRGGITIGLYSDPFCKVDYTGDIEAQDILVDLYSAESIEKWNKAYDAFKICQPCKAYNMSSTSSDSNGDSLFACKDASGSSGVNQCKMFAFYTNMYTASFQDVVLASEQGTIVPVRIYGKRYGKAGVAELTWSIISFIVSFAVMMVSFITLYWVKKSDGMSNMEEPLVSSDGVIA